MSLRAAVLAVVVYVVVKRAYATAENVCGSHWAELHRKENVEVNEGSYNVCLLGVERSVYGDAGGHGPFWKRHMLSKCKL